MKRFNNTLVLVILIIWFSPIRAQDDEDSATEEYGDTEDDAATEEYENEEPEITTRRPTTRRPAIVSASGNRDTSNNNNGCSVCAYLNNIRSPSRKGGVRYDSDPYYSYNNGRYIDSNIRRGRNGNNRNSNSRNEQRWHQWSWGRYSNGNDNYDYDYNSNDDNSLSSNGNRRRGNRNSFGNCRDGACNLRSYYNSYYSGRNSAQGRNTNTFQRCLRTFGNLAYY